MSRASKGGLEDVTTTPTSADYLVYTRAVDGLPRKATLGSTLAAAAAPTTDRSDFLSFGEASYLAGTGTWTKTRVAEADYVYRHTAAANTSILSFEVPLSVRSTAGKGNQLTSIDVIYNITTANLVAHTATLDLATYANNTARAIVSMPLTGSLATAIQTGDYVTNLAVTTPAYNNLPDSMARFELTINAASTSAYDFIGLVARYTTL